MAHVRSTEASTPHLDLPNGIYFEHGRRRPYIHAGTAGWTVIGGKDRIRTASQNRAAPALLDARGFAKILADELKSSQNRRRFFAVLIVQLPRDGMRRAEAGFRLAEIVGGNETRAAAKLAPDKLGVMLRDADAKSAALLSKEICARLERLGLHSVDVDGGVFPDDAEMIRSLHRSLAG